jgi:hypothetical protein
MINFIKNLFKKKSVPMTEPTLDVECDGCNDWGSIAVIFGKDNK